MDKSQVLASSPSPSPLPGPWGKDRFSTVRSTFPGQQIPDPRYRPHCYAVTADPLIGGDVPGDDCCCVACFRPARPLRCSVDRFDGDVAVQILNLSRLRILSIGLFILFCRLTRQMEMAPRRHLLRAAEAEKCGKTERSPPNRQIRR